MTYPLQVVFYILLALGLCLVGKVAYGLLHPRVRADQELTAKDNAAFAVPLGAYYFGILIVVGGPLSAPSEGPFLKEAIESAAWGLLAILLLNAASVVNRRFLFRGLDLSHEILDRSNLAAGVVAGGSYAANALLIQGAMAGQGGFLPAAVFWAYGQVLLSGAGRLFPRLVGYNLAAEVRRGNRAIALAYAGVLVAMGNVLRLSITGSFEGWSAGLAASTGYALFGLALLLSVRGLADWILLPGVTIRQEILEQDVPNIGVGFIVALFYLGTSLLIGWCL